MEARWYLVVLTCAKLCLSLYFDGGIPVRGMPEKCFCGEITAKDTLPPLPITLKIKPDSEKKEPEEQIDDRPNQKYEEDDD